METSYLKLVSGSRLSNYLGLEMDEGVKYKYPDVQERDYAYIEIPIRTLVGANGEPVTKAARNQQVLVVPACTVNVRGNSRFEVHPNPAFWEYGVAQGMYYLESREGVLEPGFHIALRKDLDLEIAKLAYAVRIYMRA